jgi:Carboxypeptidase regulatory-like domain/TonB-dependent Receptor Plug Domain
MSLLVAVVATAALAVSCPTRADSTVMLVGRVLDGTDSAGVSGANVQIVGTALSVRSDGRGMFRVAGVPAGQHTIEVRAFRYSRLGRTVTFVLGDSIRLDLYMDRVAQLLSEMTVHGRSMRVPRGFELVYARGARGWGTLITAEQIDSLGPRDVKSMFESIAGVVVTQHGVFFNRCYGNRELWGEYAELWIDGNRVTRFNSSDDPSDSRRFNDFLENIPPSDVQAIEVYSSSVNIPAEFTSGGSPCAVIAVWRKR